MNFKSIVLCEKLFKMFYLYEMITYLKKQLLQSLPDDSRI